VVVRLHRRGMRTLWTRVYQGTASYGVVLIQALHSSAGYTAIKTNRPTEANHSQPHDWLSQKKRDTHPLLSLKSQKGTSLCLIPDPPVSGDPNPLGKGWMR